MSLKQKLNDSLKESLIKKDALKTSVLRMVLAAMQNREIELNKRDGLDDSMIMGILMSEAKKRKEAAESFKKGDRDDLAKKEKAELEIIKEFLPEQLPDEEIAKEIDDALSENKDLSFAEAMKKLSAKLKGRADMSEVSRILKEKLGNG